MAWIFMQPAGYDEYTKASAHLDITGECIFNIYLNGARLKPISYVSQACTNMKRKFHSFVGESASGRWAIRQNQKYLWGCHL